MIARLLHGFTDRLPSLRCCGKRWNDLSRHRCFAHGEEVVIPEPPGPCIFDGCVSRDRHWHGGFPGGYDNPADPEGAPIAFTSEPSPGVRDYNGALLATVPCFCGAPAVGWVYQVMSDGQTINGLAVCEKHQEEQT